MAAPGTGAGTRVPVERAPRVGPISGSGSIGWCTCGGPWAEDSSRRVLAADALCPSAAPPAPRSPLARRAWEAWPGFAGESVSLLCPAHPVSPPHLPGVRWLPCPLPVSSKVQTSETRPRSGSWTSGQQLHVECADPKTVVSFPMGRKMVSGTRKLP